MNEDADRIARTDICPERIKGCKYGRALKKKGSNQMKKVKSRPRIQSTPSYAKTNKIQNEKIVNLTGEPITILIDNTKVSTI